MNAPVAPTPPARPRPPKPPQPPKPSRYDARSIAAMPPQHLVAGGCADAPSRFVTSLVDYDRRTSARGGVL